MAGTIGPGRLAADAAEAVPVTFLRVGIIGCGRISAGHVQALLAQPGVRIAAAADLDLARLAALAQHVPQPIETFSDYRLMIERVPLDAVLVLTPHSLHYEQVLAGLQADLHVLAEKPLVAAPAQALELIQLAQARQRVLHVAYQFPLLQPYYYARQAVMQGALGEIDYFSAVASLAWHRLDSVWRKQPDLAEGGIMIDTGSHLVDLMLHLTNLRVREIMAFTDQYGEAVEVFTSVIVRFENDRLGSIALIGEGPFLWELTVVGRQGAITIRDRNTIQHWSAADYSVGLKPDALNLAAGVMDDRTVRSTPAQEFVRAIRTGDTSTANAQRALEIAQVVQAIYESVRTRRPVLLASDPLRR